MPKSTDIRKIWNQVIEKDDKSAYDIFFNHYYPRLYRFSLEFVKIPSGAEEVVSDVMYNILNDKVRFSHVENPSAYLFKSIKNKSLSWLRNHSKEERFDNLEEVDDYIVDDSFGNNQFIPNIDVKVLLEQAVSNLPKQRQIVYRLIREEGLTVEEVESLLNLSDRTIEKHLQLAIKDLCIQLKDFLKDQRQHPRIRKLFPRNFILTFF